MSNLAVVRTPLTAAGACALLVACAAPQTVPGECRSLFEGNVCTFGTLQNGKVIEFGATVPLATITNAPDGVPMVFPPVPDAVIPLPDAVVKDTGFNHLSVNWEAHGHPPALFSTPHFDFHFFIDSPETVAAIDCADTRKPQRIPTDYALPDVDIPDLGTLTGLCVPAMGMHSMRADEIDDTEPFGATMIVGYYQQRLTFIEPMISRTKLLEARSFPLSVPTLPAKSNALRWPARAEVIFDSATQSYRVVFSRLSAI